MILVLTSTGCSHMMLVLLLRLSHILYNIIYVNGPTQVKCWLLISSIFNVTNFQHFLEMLEFNLWHFWKMSEIHYMKNARNCLFRPLYMNCLLILFLEKKDWHVFMNYSADFIPMIIFRICDFIFSVILLIIKSFHSSLLSFLFFWCNQC